MPNAFLERFTYERRDEAFRQAIRVADTGPYAHVRHPTYAGGVLVGLSSGLVFGSWPWIVPMLLYVALLAYRTLQEEKVLFLANTTVLL